MFPTLKKLKLIHCIEVGIIISLFAPGVAQAGGSRNELLKATATADTGNLQDAQQGRASDSDNDDDAVQAVRSTVGTAGQLKCSTSGFCTLQSLGCNTSRVALDGNGANSHNQFRIIENFKTIPGFNVVSLPGGTFIAGSHPDEIGHRSDETQHAESVAPIHVMDTHLTRGQYKFIMGITASNWGPPENCDGLSQGAREHWGDAANENKPMTCLSWNHLHEVLLPALRQKGVQARIPSDGEFEYLNRLNHEGHITTTAYPWGNDPKPLVDHAWFRENLDITNVIHKVREKKPIAKLFDTRGNVSSWTSTLRGYGSGAEPRALVRGSNFYGEASELRSAALRDHKPGSAMIGVGVRLAVDF